MKPSSWQDQVDQSQHRNSQAKSPMVMRQYQRPNGKCLINSSTNDNGQIDHYATTNQNSLLSLCKRISRLTERLHTQSNLTVRLNVLKNILSSYEQARLGHPTGSTNIARSAELTTIPRRQQLTGRSMADIPAISGYVKGEHRVYIIVTHPCFQELI